MQAEYMTTSEAARYIRRTPRTVRNWIQGFYLTGEGKNVAFKDGRNLPAKKVRGGYLIKRTDLDKFICATN